MAKPKAYYIGDGKIEILKKDYGNERVTASIDELFSDEYIENVNKLSDSVSWRSDYINEIFFNFMCIAHDYKQLLMLHDVQSVSIEKYDNKAFIFILESLKLNLKLAVISKLIYYIVCSGCFCLFVPITFCLSFCLPLYTFLVHDAPPKKVDSNQNGFSIIRSKAAKEKMSFLKDEHSINFYIDNYVLKDNTFLSMYSLLNMKDYIRSFLLIPVIIFRDMVNIVSDSYRLFGLPFSGIVVWWYKIRLPHKAVFEFYLDIIMNKSKANTYYTGNKEDRFAICEGRIAKKNKYKIICIPHGVEYSFKRPAGLVGDIFYCTSDAGKNHLEKLYKQRGRFVFDESVAHKMFSKNIKRDIKPKIVFFTEGRGIHVDIKIIEGLIDANLKFYVKLHPKDNMINYTQFKDKINFIDDFSIAITGNICIARKSTILIEALYNRSISIAILLDKSDIANIRYWFPSLQTDLIHKCYSIDKLKELICLHTENSIHGETFSQLYCESRAKPQES